MTKYSLLIGLVALIGCTSDAGDTGDTGVADTDVGDTDTDTDGPAEFAMTGEENGEGFSGSCASGFCVYQITTTSPALVDLEMTETGDPAKFFYNEFHDGNWELTTNANGTETYRLELTWVTDLEDVVANETTLFNPNVGDGNVLDRTTWVFMATNAADSSDTDCRVTGENPDYFSKVCSNVVTGPL